MKLFMPDNAHWYLVDGSPLHTVLAANGQPRPTTLRDARKLGLLPSVTNILGVIAKPELDSWKQEQAVVAALTLPRIEGESEDAFAKRVVKDALTTRDSAADFGTAFHHGAQEVARTRRVDASHPAAAWLRLYGDWFAANCARLVWAERVLVNFGQGYAGTADLLMEHQQHGLTLVDLKTQNVKGTSGPATYRSWGYQLAAYRAAQAQRVTCMNLIVNSREPHAPVEAVWSEEEMGRCWEGFSAALKLWQIEKNYNPVGRGARDEGLHDHGLRDHKPKQG